MICEASIAEVFEAIRDSWTAATSLDDAWTPENRSLGQCAVSALVVQDYLGGYIRRGVVSGTSHYWNVLPSGEEVDLTRDQFSVFQPSHVEDRDRDYVLSFPNTKLRYQLLASCVERLLRERSHAASE